MNDVERAQQGEHIAPLIAMAWPDKNSDALNQLYEAMTLLLVEEFDLLILVSSVEANRVKLQLGALDLPEESVHFFDFKAPSLDIAKHFTLVIVYNQDGSERIDLNEIANQANPEALLTQNGNEFLETSNKVFVPFYDEDVQDDVLMDISQKFPSREVIALNCEILKSHQIKFSDLILFANE